VTIRTWICSSCSSLLALPCLLMSAPAQAQPAPSVSHLDDTYRVEASAADLILATTMRIGTTEIPGTEVDIEDLGIERGAFSPRFAFGWHPRRRHEFEVGYQFIRRTGERAVADSIVFGGTTFPKNKQVSTAYNSDNLYATYRLGLFVKPDTRAGLLFTLGAIFFDLRLEALRTSGSGTGTSIEFTDERALLGLGVFFDHRFNQQWDLRASGGAIGASGSDFSFSEYQLGLTGRYFISNRWGIDASYGLAIVNLEIKGTRPLFTTHFVGKFHYNYQNPRLGVVVAFQ
jgi:hypothetical protein